jgi:hypothetical protein
MAEHAGDALSALLDGELTAAEAAEVHAHVAACDECARELDDVRTTRRLVRELPAVDPPTWFVDELLAGDTVVPFGRRRPGRGALVGQVAASVVAGVLLLGVAAGNVDPAAIEPEVSGAAVRHASTVSALEAGGLLHGSPQRFVPDEPAPPTTAEPRSVDDLPAPYDAPTTLAGYRLVEAYRSMGGVHLLYRKGDYCLSVFEVAGSIDWSALPPNGTAIEVRGERAWRWDDADGRLLVVEHDGVVVMIVSDERGDLVVDVADALPQSRELPLRARVKQSVSRALEMLAP